MGESSDAFVKDGVGGSVWSVSDGKSGVVLREEEFEASGVVAPDDSEEGDGVSKSGRKVKFGSRRRAVGFDSLR